MTDQQPPAERRPISSFSDLVPRDWRDPADYAAVILEIYSSGIALESPVRKLTEYARSVVHAACSHPVTWHYMRLTQDQPVSSLTARSVYSEGERTIIAHYGEDVIPSGDYIVFASPVIRTENGGTAEGEPTQALRAARGTLMALGGHTAAEQLILRTMPSTEKLDHMTRTAGPFENYAPPDIFAFCEPESIAQLGAKMALHMEAARRRRLATALTFLGRAAAEMDSTVRFSHLWIALEVAAGGYGKLNAVFQQIAVVVGARKKLADIKDARDQLFHHGRRYALSQDQERLICAAIFAQLLSWFGVKDDKTSGHNRWSGRFVRARTDPRRLRGRGAAMEGWAKVADVLKSLPLWLMFSLAGAGLFILYGPQLAGLDLTWARRLPWLAPATVLACFMCLLAVTARLWDLGLRFLATWLSRTTPPSLKLTVHSQVNTTWWHEAVQQDGSVTTQICIDLSAYNPTDVTVRISGVRLIRPSVPASLLLPPSFYLSDPGGSSLNSPQYPVAVHGNSSIRLNFMVRCRLARSGRFLRVRVGLTDQNGHEYRPAVRLYPM